MARLERVVESLSRKVDTLSARLEGTNSKMDRIEELCAKVEARVEAIELMDDRLKSIEMKVGDLERNCPTPRSSSLSRSPSQGMGCFYTRELGHFREECPQQRSLKVNDSDHGLSGLLKLHGAQPPLAVEEQTKVEESRGKTHETTLRHVNGMGTVGISSGRKKEKKTQI